MSAQQDRQTQYNSKEQEPHGLARRALSRSPHPYHRQQAELPHPTLKPATTFPVLSPLRSRQNTGEEEIEEVQVIYRWHGSPEKSAESDSGTEADDEHFLKGLPAPRWRPHKGLRGIDGSISSSPSPLVSPASLHEESGRVTDYLRKGSGSNKRPCEEDVRIAAEKLKRNRRAEIGRRASEVTLLVVVGSIVISSYDVLLVIRSWKNEIICLVITIASLIVLYPFRLVIYLASGWSVDRWPSIIFPSSFDPAPILYPPVLTMLVSLILSVPNHSVLLPNIILSMSSLPSELIPVVGSSGACNSLHWLLSCLPLIFYEKGQVSDPLLPLDVQADNLDREALALLYPLHSTLCITLHYLTTTSLLRAELQLLSIALINVLLLSTSPQAVILKGLLWMGGIGMLITCTHVLRWVVALARVPRWRFRRVSTRESRSSIRASRIGSGVLLAFLKGLLGMRMGVMEDLSDDEDFPDIETSQKAGHMKLDFENVKGLSKRGDGGQSSVSTVERGSEHKIPAIITTAARGFIPSTNRRRRHTLPNVGHPDFQSNQRTPSGRRKRSASSSVQSFFSLTESQAATRKLVYASYVYLSVVCIILLGIRPYVGKYALRGSDPIGWALGYLFGNLPWFRMEVIKANLEHWICLPGRNPNGNMGSCRCGWVEHLRQETFGPANVRLILCGYWLAIIIVGLTIVFRLSAIYEVDTRRKVFHFMMVAMLLPATYVDPTFAALALTLVLAIFLLLDLFRASQLPPLSKPLAYFLTPYVDGRDLRGPVVISHIFLLIGSAIPLWLSLGTVPRTGSGPWMGWEVPTRDVSMVSGVICVGMGDAAASLIGRRYGRHKWFWGGGKSLEGSLAFTTAVATALLAGKAWLRIGGWPESGNNNDSWTMTIQKSGVAAGLASLTEAVLTGGNDNVVVPVVLWVCVKGLGI